MLTRLIRSLLKLIPASQRTRLKHRLGVPDATWSLRNMKRLGFRPRTIIDVGAYEGTWTRDARAHFPDASVLMVEAQPDKAGRLASVAAAQGRGVSFEIAVLGEAEKEEISFFVNETVSSVLPECESDAATQVSAPMTTLDRLTDDTAFARPDFIKLDVQGYELNVLRGAARLLEEHPPEAIFMEVSLIEINEGAPLFHDVCTFMDAHRYRLYDICSFMRRPLDDALWQVDAIFVHASSSLVASKHWT